MLLVCSPVRLEAGDADESSQTRAPSRSFGISRAGALTLPGTQVGLTYFDYQHNASTGRQVDKFGDFIQLSYMRQSLPQLSPGRTVNWNRVSVIGSPGPLTLDNGNIIGVLPLGTPASPLGTAVGSEAQQGYTTLRLTPRGEAVVLYHSVPTLDSWAASVDSVAESGIFSYAPNPFPAPQPPELATTDRAIWPKGTVDVVGTDTVLHVAAVEGNTVVGILRLYYWRGILTHPGSVASIVWASPVLVDTLNSWPNAVVEADPTSDNVAICYTRTTAGTGNRDDVAYRVSTDGGLGWGAVINITNYTITSPQSAYAAMTASYDGNGTLHLIYSTYPFNFNSNYSPTMLWHWNNQRQTSRMVTAAYWHNTCSEDSARGGEFNLQLAKPSLSVKPAGAGPGAGIADEVLYAVWVQFGPTQTDCATRADGVTLGGHVNAELWWSSSSDDGLTWDEPKNITGTETPDCAPGDCHSEHWVSAAARCDSGVYLSYVDDTHAGGIALSEGTWSLSPYKVLALEARAPAATARLVVLPADPVTWTQPYWSNQINLVAPPAGITTDRVVVWNPGTAQLNFTATIVNLGHASNSPLVNGLTAYNSSIAAGGAPETLTVSYDPVGLVNNLDFDLEITSNAALAQRKIEASDFTIQWNWGTPATCPIVITGDVNVSGAITSADVITLVNYVFKSGLLPMPCEAAGDVNCNGSVTSADVIALVNHVFKGGPAPCDGCTSTLASGC